MHLALGFPRGNPIKQAWDCTKLISSQALWNKKVKNHKRKSKMEKSMVPFTAQRNNLHLPPWKLLGQALQASRLWLVPADKWHQCWEERCDCIHSHKVMSLWFSPLPLCLQTKKMFAMFSHRRNCAMQGLAKSSGNAHSIQKGWQDTKGTLQCPEVMVRVTQLLFGSRTGPNTKCPPCQHQRLCADGALHSTLQTSAISHFSGPPHHQMFLYTAQRLSLNSSKQWIHNFSLI